MATFAEATQAADRLKAQGRWDEAIAAHRAISRSFPREPVAFHNLAATLGDAGHAAAAEAALLQAMKLGLDAPESWLVRARAVQAQGRLDEAEALFGQALARRPLFIDALRDLAQLRWMRRADVAAALQPIDSALARAPDEPALVLLKARVLIESAGPAAALDLLRHASRSRPAHGPFAHALAQAALQAGEPTESLAAAERAVALAPNESATQVARIDALLVLGEWQRAEQAALQWQARAPFDQHALARLSTAWRLLGDERYHRLCDYDTLVSVQQLATPAGWSGLESYLADLAGALHAAHRYRTHPFQQSVRQGSQLAHILQLPHPAAQALASAIDAPIRQHLARLGAGADPVRAVNRGTYATRGGWSIRMQAGGQHMNHVHPEGWISSACYVEAPAALTDGQGSLKLGEPGIPLDPLPPPERLVAPALGRIVLFPSYMWHGTVAFTAEGVRMSVAFDLVPGPAAAPA